MTDVEGRGLYAPTLAERERAASGFTVFPEGGPAPVGWANDWAQVLRGRDVVAGEKWPEPLREKCVTEAWPQHAFGTANAAVLLLWHRPGQAKADEKPPTDRPHWLDPS